MKKGMKRALAAVAALMLLLGAAPAGAEKEMRPEKQGIAIMREGETEVFPCALHEGKGYSLYLPEGEEWLYGQGKFFGAPWERWVSAYNDQVALTVMILPDTTAAEARQQFRAASPDYELIEDKRGGLGGMKDDWLVMDIALRPAASSQSVYALILQYPLEASEGFGVILSAMADSFQLD